MPRGKQEPAGQIILDRLTAHGETLAILKSNPNIDLSNECGSQLKDFVNAFLR